MGGVKFSSVNYIVKISLLYVNLSSQIYHIYTVDEVRKTESLL